MGGSDKWVGRHQSGSWGWENPVLGPAQLRGCHVRDGEGKFPPTLKHPLAGHGFDSAQVREDQEAVVSWLLHKVLLLVPRSPTPRTNCSSRPPMAPEGLGAAARSPTVLLYAAKKAERTSCSREGGKERINALSRGRIHHPHPYAPLPVLLHSPVQGQHLPLAMRPCGSGP